MPTHLAGHGQHMLQIGRAIFLRRRAHGDEYHLTMVHGVGHFGGEVNAAFGPVATQQFLQSRLINGHTCRIEQSDFFRVVVYAQNLMSQFSQACARDQTHIARTDHRDFHKSPLELTDSENRLCLNDERKIKFA